ncbi:MAG: ATP-binding protein [Solirubrobacterales bacterium]
MSLVALTAVGGAVALAALVAGLLRYRLRSEAVARGLHELRRPLQALTFAAAGSRDRKVMAQVDLTFAALDDLERVVGGSSPSARRTLVDPKQLCEDAIGRWEAAARHRGRSVRMHWNVEQTQILADPIRLAQALDNLIANALEHGGGTVSCIGSLVNGQLRISVRDRGGSSQLAWPLTAGRERRGRRRAARTPLRGHGLKVVDDVATSHDGRFALHPSMTGTVAVLEVPIPAGGAES